MSTTVFPFTVSRPYSEYRALATVGRGIGSGVVVRRSELGAAPGWLYAVTFALRFPRDSQTVDTFDTFVQTHLGNGTFLFKAHRLNNKYVSDGATGDGSNKVFTLTRKHVDESTLLVYVNSVLQTLTTHYTITLNNTTPTITFVTAPGNGLAVVATYDFYMPCWFVDDNMIPELKRGGATSATLPHVIPRVSLTEQYPGAHLA